MLAGGLIVGLATVLGTVFAGLPLLTDTAEAESGEAKMPRGTITSPTGNLIPQCATLSGHAEIPIGQVLWVTYETPNRMIGLAKAIVQIDGSYTVEDTVGGAHDGGKNFVFSLTLLSDTDSKFVDGIKPFGNADNRPGYLLYEALPPSAQKIATKTFTRDPKGPHSHCGASKQNS
jgi:hypothetical protein